MKKRKRKLITTLDGKSSMPPPIDFKKILKEKKKSRKIYYKSNRELMRELKENLEKTKIKE